MLKNLTVQKQIIGGFASILLLMISIMIASRLVTAHTTASFKKLLDNDVRMMNLVSTAEIFMLQARQYEKDFFIHKHRNLIKKHTNNIKKVIGEQEELKTLAQVLGDQEIVDRVQLVQALTREYKQQFDKMVQAQIIAGLDHTSGLQGEFRQAAHSLEKDLSSYDVASLMTALLQIRRYEKDFLRSLGNPVSRAHYKKKFIEALKNYETALAASRCDSSAKQEQLAALTAYKNASKNWLTTKEPEKRDRLYDYMRKQAHRIEQTVHSVNVPGALVLLLELRKHEKDYLLRAITNMWSAFILSLENCGRPSTPRLFPVSKGREPLGFFQPISINLMPWFNRKRSAQLPPATCESQSVKWNRPSGSNMNLFPPVIKKTRCVSAICPTPWGNWPCWQALARSLLDLPSAIS